MEFFWKISTIFLRFFGKFLQFFGKFLRFFGKFLQSSAIFRKIFPKILAHNPLRFDRGLAIIVSLQVSLQVSLHLYL